MVLFSNSVIPPVLNVQLQAALLQTINVPLVLQTITSRLIICQAALLEQLLNTTSMVPFIRNATQLVNNVQLQPALLQIINVQLVYLGSTLKQIIWVVVLLEHFLNITSMAPFTRNAIILVNLVQLLLVLLPITNVKLVSVTITPRLIIWQVASLDHSLNTTSMERFIRIVMPLVKLVQRHQEQLQTINVLLV
jgi:hypothetical protein